MQAVSNTGRSGVLVLKVDEDDVNTVLMNNSINTFPYREQVQTVLILMPIEAKKKLVKCMLEKIWHMQNI